MKPSLRSNRDDRGVVALEFVLAAPFLLALLVCILTFAGLFQTKSRVVGAARDGARALALQAGVATPNADTNGTDGITVVLVPPKCPPLSDTSYQSPTPPKVTAEASKLYTVSVPFVHTWTDIQVLERATMPCG
jgi:hypothetical protein